MTLHEAIELVLRGAGRAMTAREISESLNKNKWYLKGDNSEIKASQIIARANNYQNLFDIDRIASPLEIKLRGSKINTSQNTSVVSEKHETRKVLESGINSEIRSFSPISNSDTSILILGTIPGEKSLLQNEYYAHAGNKFWKIIGSLTRSEIPASYPDKVELLLTHGIGIWDIAHRAIRKGSLDSAIKDEEPNDLEGFISRHPKLKVIAFNGTKSQVLFDKYFKRKANIKYMCFAEHKSCKYQNKF